MKKVMRWDESLNVGISVIDNQHKILFDLANDLNHAIHNGASIQVIDTLFAVINNYAFKHFDTEEGFIKEESDFTRHCFQHYQLLKQMNNYIVDYRNSRDVVVEPGEFLEKWLLNHIKESDIPLLSKKTIDLSQLGRIDEFDDFEIAEVDLRKDKRIRFDKILDEDIYGQCYNATAMSTCTVSVVDLSGGGLKIYSEKKHNIDDLLVISCRVGKSFRMREKVQVKNIQDNFYGVEFVSPSKETVRFLTEICGAVHFA